MRLRIHIEEMVANVYMCLFATLICVVFLSKGNYSEFRSLRDVEKVHRAKMLLDKSQLPKYGTMSIVVVFTI